MSVLATISEGSNSVTVDVASTLIPTDTEASDISVIPMNNSSTAGYMSSTDYSTFDSSALTSQNQALTTFVSSGDYGWNS